MQDFALKILVVEDNDELRQVTLSFLQSCGHYVRGVPMAEEIGDVTGAFVPDIYVVDLNLPDEDGLSLTRRLRATHASVGIIITTARAQVGDKVLGYKSGADIYLTKPVHPRELAASIAALGNRIRGEKTQQASLCLKLSRLQLLGAQGCVELTSGESSLLTALVRAPGQTLERWQLAQVIGIGGEKPAAATIEMRITRLRKKLLAAGAQSPCIKALHKVGYTLCCEINLS